jgi:uncharacterized membrane protein
MYKVLVVLLGLYAIFTTGIAYELASINNTASLEVPYSLGISGERTGLSNVLYDSDIECAKWVMSHEINKKIAVDYNGLLLLRIYTPLDTELGYRLFRWENEVKVNDLVFCSSWNSKHGALIVGSSVGLRTPVKIDYEGLVGIYRVGDSVIYEKLY